MVNQIKARYKQRRNPAGKKVPRDALDSLMSVDRKERERAERDKLLQDTTDDSAAGDTHSQDLFDYESDSSGNGTRFKHRTGIFSQDFPVSPAVPKGKGGKGSKRSKKDSVDEATDSKVKGSSGTGNGAGAAGVPVDSVDTFQQVYKANVPLSDTNSIEATTGNIKQPTSPPHEEAQTESDIEVPPSGTIARETLKTKESLHFNILKGRYSRRHMQGINI